ncbi:hypothetical protein ILUMI_04981 [Ignelater luminosus]|uniref:Uncharacterized protein n=1 Tax=Ignelater luminosus TaxID=2038154 RepID=A0A8K0DD78_IGNLU|nr:hypothetical protein ILUMI_04981 [Ignelater luminosus]
MDAIIVYEGENVRLRCAATGIPKPHVEWKRTDGQLIHSGTHKAISIPGENLNLTHINRVHMGSYQCIADNGISPQANHTFHLKVYFPPLIRLRSQTIGAKIGSSAILECEVEAFPESATYWERVDGQLLENGTTKYNILYTPLINFKAVMTLKITSINDDDLTTYYCISKNERGITRGTLTVYEVAPGLATSGDGKVVTVFGTPAPEVVSIEQLCPPIVECKKCPDVTYVTKNCTGTGYLFDLIYRWEIVPFKGHTNKIIPKRNQDCVLEAIGKPVYHGYADEDYGSWMMDSDPANDFEGSKYWITNESTPNLLYEFSQEGNLTQTYRLALPFQGNAHVVYNGSFYYHAQGKPQIIRYFLKKKTKTELNVTELIAMDSSNALYKTGYNYLDFSVDDNGLWVIFPVPDSNNTGVMKVNDSMHIQKMWNFSMEHQKVGEMFVACGVLYAIDSISTYHSKVRFALDLYTERLVEINLDFTNPFESTTMATYNHRKKELHTWDSGTQLKYPVLYHPA